MPPSLILARELYTFSIGYYSKSKECLKFVKVLPDPLPQHSYWTFYVTKMKECRKKCLSFSPWEPQSSFSSQRTPDFLSTYLRINSLKRFLSLSCQDIMVMESRAFCGLSLSLGLSATASDSFLKWCIILCVASGHWWLLVWTWLTWWRWYLCFLPCQVTLSSICN